MLQLTDKAIIKEGGRYRKPHYLCGAFAADSEPGSIFICSQTLVTEPRKQKFFTEPAPRFRREFVARRNKALKVSRGDSGFLPSGTPLDMEKPGSKKRKLEESGVKMKGRNKQRASVDPSDEFALALYEDSKDAVQLLNSSPRGGSAGVRTDDHSPGGGDDTPGGESENSPGTVENLPLKVVAVQRLRWNFNKGKETWLAFGGAAGIVRCQYVVPKD